MFEKGDLILYETAGVCRIEEISRLEFLKNDRVYYSLVPVFEKDSVMRPIMSREEAEAFIEQLAAIEGRRDIGEKEKAQVYKQILLSGNHRELAAMIKGIFEVGQVRKGKGNRLAVRDEENMKRAQKLLYGELAAALGMHPDQMPAYIGKRLESPAVV